MQPFLSKKKTSEGEDSTGFLLPLFEGGVEVVGEFKEIRKAKDLPAARQKMNDFIEHWKKRYKRVEKLAELSGLFTFCDFPEAIRSTIYTTNVIESFNKHLKHQIDKKEQFPNEDALDP